MTTHDPRSTSPIVWDWSDALYGAVIAAPAAVTVMSDVPRGLAFAVGVLPSAVMGVLPTRRARAGSIVLGMLTGASLLLGSLLSHVPWVAVPALFLLCVGVAVQSAGHRLGRLALVLSLPMVAVGLSYRDLGEAAGLALLMVLGSCAAFVISQLWPVRDAESAAPSPQRSMLGYGVRLGLAASTSAAIGFALDLDHVGWACAATLLVMRPSRELQEVRSVGRVLAVAAGALAAGVVATVAPEHAVYAVATVGCLAGASATHRSRWYVTSAFSTFLALSLLVYGDPGQAGSRFVERLVETSLGVGVAYLFGLALPRLGRATVDEDARPSLG